jgi:hypothetical protein
MGSFRAPSSNKMLATNLCPQRKGERSWLVEKVVLRVAVAAFAFNLAVFGAAQAATINVTVTGAPQSGQCNLTDPVLDLGDGHSNRLAQFVAVLRAQGVAGRGLGLRRRFGRGSRGGIPRSSFLRHSQSEPALPSVRREKHEEHLGHRSPGGERIFLP